MTNEINSIPRIYIERKRKNNVMTITELMKEIEFVRQEDNLESQVAQSVIDLESQIQANNVIMSEIKL